MRQLLIYTIILASIYLSVNSLLMLAENNSIRPYVVSQTNSEAYISHIKPIIENNCSKTHIDCYKVKYTYRGTLDFQHNFEIHNKYNIELSQGQKVPIIIKHYSNGESEYFINMANLSPEIKDNKLKFTNKENEKNRASVLKRLRREK